MGRSGWLGGEVFYAAPGSRSGFIGKDYYDIALAGDASGGVGGGSGAVGGLRPVNLCYTRVTYHQSPDGTCYRLTQEICPAYGGGEEVVSSTRQDYRCPAPVLQDLGDSVVV